MNQVSFHRAHLLFSEGNKTNESKEGKEGKEDKEKQSNKNKAVAIDQTQGQINSKEESNKLKILSVEMIKNSKGIGSKTTIKKGNTLTTTANKTQSIFTNGSLGKSKELCSNVNNRRVRVNTTGTNSKTLKEPIPKPNKSSSNLTTKKLNSPLTNSYSNKLIPKLKTKIDEDSDISTRPATTGVLVKNVKISVDSKLNGVRSCSSLQMKRPITSKTNLNKSKGNEYDSNSRKFGYTTTRNFSKEHKSMQLHNKTSSLTNSKQTLGWNLNKLNPSSTRSNPCGINFNSSKGIGSRVSSSLMLHTPSNSLNRFKSNRETKPELKIVRVVTNKSLNPISREKKTKNI